MYRIVALCIRLCIRLCVGLSDYQWHYLPDYVSDYQIIYKIIYWMVYGFIAPLRLNNWADRCWRSRCALQGAHHHRVHAARALSTACPPLGLHGCACASHMCAGVNMYVTCLCLCSLDCLCDCVRMCRWIYLHFVSSDLPFFCLSSPECWVHPVHMHVFVCMCFHMFKSPCMPARHVCIHSCIYTMLAAHNTHMNLH